MRELGDFHHFSALADLSEDPMAALERYVVQMLVRSPVGDERRESSIEWELKHSSAVLQFARLLARKRGLPMAPCEAGAVLHDVYVIAEGRYADHAHLGQPMAREIMETIGGFSEETIESAGRLIYHHSDKHVWSNDPMAEFGKDVDVIDCFLYADAFDYYLRHKRLEIFAHYLRRAKQMWTELGLPPEHGFYLLDDFAPGTWLSATAPVPGQETGPVPIDPAARPFAVACIEGQLVVAAPSGRDAERGCNWAAGSGRPHLPRVDGHVLVVWPGIARFQLLRPSTDGERIAELGIEGSRPAAQTTEETV